MFKYRSTDPIPATNPAPEPDAHGLPSEYLDPSNRLFVPAELRPHYRNDPIGGMLALRSDPTAARTLARRIERERLAADPDAWRLVLDREAQKMGNKPPRLVAELVQKMDDDGPHRWQPDIEEGDRLERALTSDDWAYGAHLRELEAAEHKRVRAERNANTRVKVRESRTCAVCGDVRDDVRPYKRHGSAVEPVSRGGYVQACEPCAHAVAAHLTALAAAELVNGRSRAELAAEYVEAQP